MLGSLLGVHHVGIVVQNIEASVAWYVKHLNFEGQYSYRFPGVDVTFIQRGQLKIELFETEQSTPMADERAHSETNLKIGGINHFAIEVKNLDEVMMTLKEKGVKIISPPRDVPNGNGDRFAFIHDNESMLIELFEAA